MRATEETCRTTYEETEVYNKYREIIQRGQRRSPTELDSEKELLHLTSLTPNLVHNIRLD
jgi:hypothetical protein